MVVIRKKSTLTQRNQDFFYKQRNQDFQTGVEEYARILQKGKQEGIEK